MANMNKTESDAWNTRAEKTCRLVVRNGGVYCSECGANLVGWYENAEQRHLPRFCMCCGSKVVE